ncbi:MAG: hypothetical protein NTW87_07935 [Planctomycetota bacterium]|nr:hypothetical protein [Planctomycetota bacterium]
MANLNVHRVRVDAVRPRQRDVRLAREGVQVTPGQFRRHQRLHIFGQLVNRCLALFPFLHLGGVRW